VSRTIIGDELGWQIAAAVTVALLIWTFENYVTVCLGVALLHNIPLKVALQRLRPAKPADYALVLVAWWILAVVLVASYGSWATWSLAVFVLFAMILRQALVGSETAYRAERLAEEQRQAVVALSDRIVDERRDERFRLAGELHDELIPRLFELSLLGRVLEQELLGKSAESIAADVASMRHSADAALEISREVIHGLRTNPLGPGKLRSALLAMAAELESQSHCAIQSAVEALPPMPEMQELVIYQVAREALTNAARHSRATSVDFAVFRDSRSLILSVEDDGLGFGGTPTSPGHFGLLIMRERTAAVGGSIYVDSTLGRGTKVTAIFALDQTALVSG
jgi:signal transduction histidine kinase